MNALLILSLLAGPDEIAEARKLQGPLLGASGVSYGEALKDVRAVWQCGVLVSRPARRSRPRAGPGGGARSRGGVGSVRKARSVRPVTGGPQ